jgi:hypothetical protein
MPYTRRPASDSCRSRPSAFLLGLFMEMGCLTGIRATYERQTPALEDSEMSKNNGFVDFAKRMPPWEWIWLHQMNPVSPFPYRFEGGATRHGGGPRVGIEIIGALLASLNFPKDILLWSIRCPV